MYIFLGVLAYLMILVSIIYYMDMGSKLFSSDADEKFKTKKEFLLSLIPLQYWFKLIKDAYDKIEK